MRFDTFTLSLSPPAYLSPCTFECTPCIAPPSLIPGPISYALFKCLPFLINASGCIAQWLERLTADQQVPGSNPGVPLRLTFFEP